MGGGGGGGGQGISVRRRTDNVWGIKTKQNKTKKRQTQDKRALGATPLMSTKRISRCCSSCCYDEKRIKCFVCFTRIVSSLK